MAINSKTLSRKVQVDKIVIEYILKILYFIFKSTNTGVKTMKKYFAIGIMFLVMASTSFAGKTHQFGLGVNFWDTTDEPIDYDSSGMSYFGTYRYTPGLWGIEANLEYYPEDSVYTDNDVVWEPQALFVIGSWIYGAAGIGWPIGDSEIANQPAAYLKAGLNLSILPLVKLDISGKYKYQRLKDFSDNNKKHTVDGFVIGASINIAL
jgi:hypothetical protein